GGWSLAGPGSLGAEHGGLACDGGEFPRDSASEPVIAGDAPRGRVQPVRERDACTVRGVLCGELLEVRHPELEVACGADEPACALLVVVVVRGPGRAGLECGPVGVGDVEEVVVCAAVLALVVSLADPCLVLLADGAALVEPVRIPVG